MHGPLLTRNEKNHKEDLRVLYEDNHVIAVFKPAGLPVQGGTGHEDSLLSRTRDLIKRESQKPGNVFLGLVHRLDLPVRGVVVFGKTSKGASRLSEQFRLRSVSKIYLAFVEGIVEKDSGHLVDTIEDKKAVLDFEVVRREKDRTLVRVKLETGRKHQIRIQFSKIGHPLVGDKKYGARQSWAHGIALVASSLTFDHVVQKTPVEISVPAELLPVEFQ